MDEERKFKVLQEDKFFDITVGTLFLVVGVLCCAVAFAHLESSSAGFAASLVFGGLFAALGTSFLVQGIRG